jgi:FeS assembly SUF system protein
MSDETHDKPKHLPLEVLNPAAKVEQLKREFAAAPARANLNNRNVIDRALDQSKTSEQKAVEEKIIDALRLVYDPEIPVNIYDLGLIYDVQISEANRVVVKMTLTAPACPVAGSIVAEVERRVENIPEVTSATVELVWDPPWTKEKMSEAALLELGLL